MAESPLLSVCVVNWNTKDDLLRALGSIACGGIEDPEIIVVDNNSDDGSADAVLQQFPQAHLIRNKTNVGFSKAYNQAIRATRGHYILLLNPDTVIHPDALRQLVGYLATHPKVGAAGPKLLNGDGTLQYSCRRFPDFMAGLYRNTPLGWFFPENKYSRSYLMEEWDHATARDVDWVSGAALCIRRKTLREVGMLDEGFFMYCEDVDWCYRAQKKGWRIHYVPDAVITHLIGRSSDQRPVAMVREFHRSMALFYRKHYAYRWPALLRWIPFTAIKMRLWATLIHHRRHGTSGKPVPRNSARTIMERPPQAQNTDTCSQNQAEAVDDPQ